MNKVCKTQKVTNILEPLTHKNDKKGKLQRFNLFHHIMVNEKFKVLFCFIPKVGCSNMKRIFLVMDGLYSSVETVNIKKMNQEIVRLEKFPQEKREYMLKNFYKFMFVRDPYERLASAYRNKWLNNKNIELHANLGRRIIAKYRYNNTKEPQHGDDVSFTEFVQYLTDNPPWDVNEHWMPYEDLCRPCNIQYDFIGSIDTLRRDVVHAMRQIHANETKYHMIKISGSPLTQSKKKSAGFLKELPKKYFDKLLAYFKRDHELFDYPLPEYETLDKRYPA